MDSGDEEEKMFGEEATYISQDLPLSMQGAGTRIQGNLVTGKSIPPSLLTLAILRPIRTVPKRKMQECTQDQTE